MLPHEVPAGALAIDTDAFSAVHWGRGRQAEFSALIDGHELAMPFPVVGELRVGAIRARLGARRRRLLGEAIDDCVTIPSDERIVEEWARLRARLMSQLAGEGINDLWIAACCLVYDLPLVTANLRDFTTIQQVEPRLRIVHPDI